VLCLIDHGYNVTIIDNLDNAFEEAWKSVIPPPFNQGVMPQFL
jgi:hypothetical protein